MTAAIRRGIDPGVHKRSGVDTLDVTATVVDPHLVGLCRSPPGQKPSRAALETWHALNERQQIYLG